MSTEQTPNDIRVEGGSQKPQELLSQETMDKLGIKPEVLEAIKGLKPADKQEVCILMLEDILDELKTGKLSPSDAKDKTKSTLTEYGILVTNLLSNGEQESKKLLDYGESSIQRFEKLQKDLEAVKSLDPAVGEELKKAKQAKPDLPPELAKTISKQTGKEIQTVSDIETKGGEKSADIQNIVDSYYLANFGVEENVTKLLEGKKSKEEVQRAFSELRNSARKLEIPVDVRSAEIQKLIPDLSDKKQSQITDTVSSLTRGAPETTVTRTGEKLSFVDPKNARYNYEIDLSKEPPKLAKTLNGLSISRNIAPLSPEKQEISRLEGDVQKISETLRGQKASESISTIAGVDTSIIEEQTKDGKNPEERQTLERYTNTKKSLAQTLKDGNPAERLDAIKKMKEVNHALDGTRRKLINPENMNNAKQEVLEQALWKEQESLTYLETLYQPLVDKSGRIKTLKEQTKNEETDEDFDKNARYNLNFLAYIGYDGLGQENMERIIRTLNSPENPKRSEIGEIDLNKKLDTPKTQALTLALANLVRAGRKDEIKPGTEQTPEQKKTEESQKTWDGVDKTDPIIAARQTQSVGFREALSGVKRNMMNEGGSLKTDSAIRNAVLGNTEGQKSEAL